MTKKQYNKLNSIKRSQIDFKQRFIIDDINIKDSNKNVVETIYNCQKRKSLNKSEADIQFQIFDWFNNTYSKQNYRLHCSFNGVKLPIGLATKLSKRGMQKSEPDLHLYNRNIKYTSLYIELKVESPYKKDGTLKSMKKTDKFGISYNHLERQAEFLMFLQSQGAAATFAVGFDGATKAITNYINNDFVNCTQMVMHIDNIYL